MAFPFITASLEVHRNEPSHGTKTKQHRERLLKNFPFFSYLKLEVCTLWWIKLFFTFCHFLYV